MLLSNPEKNKPDFSVVVNCRDSERFLKQCLESIRNQTHANFEVIIWDNKSRDNTFEIASSFGQADNRFKVFQSASPLHLGEARNMAIGKARGEYIAFLDSDDLWDSNFLAEHIHILNNCEEKVFGIGNVIEIDSRFSLQHPFGQVPPQGTQSPTKNIFKKLLKGNTVYFSSLVIPSHFFIDEAGFKSEYIQAEDYELLLRAARKMKCYKVGLAYYRIHEGNTTSSQQEALFVELLQILEKYSNYFWGWIIFRLIAIRYFLFMSSLNFGDRISKLKALNIDLGELIMGALILTAVKFKSQLLRRKKS